MKRALILGVGGQDGSYLAELLLEKGYEVHGLYRRSSVDNLWRIAGIRDKITLHQGDMSDPLSADRVIRKVMPDELYNEADQDHVGWSYETPGYSADITYGAVARLLDSVLEINRQWGSRIQVFQPLSATMFGDAPAPQNEQTPLNPLSPYACAKAAAFHLCHYYRQVHGMYVATAIFYNHDSVRRSGEYLLHQICKAAATGDAVVVGDDRMWVDIGDAEEYMEAAWNIMQLPDPDDFVIASNNCMSIGLICDMALYDAGRKGEKYRVDPSRLRPGPKAELIGSTAKAEKAFGFNPKSDLSEFIPKLVEHYASTSETTQLVRR